MRPERQFRARWAATAAVLAGTAAAGLAVVGVRSMDDSESAAPGKAAPTVLALRPSQVRRLVVEAGDQRAEVLRDSNGVWRSRVGTPAQSAALLVGFEDELLPMLAYRAVRSDPTQPDFALVEPALAASFEDTSGRHQRISLGGPTFTGGGYYLRRGDDEDRIFLVPRRTMDGLRSVLAGTPVTSGDPLRQRAAEIEADQQAAESAPRTSTYLRQVLDGGAEIPPEQP